MAALRSALVMLGRRSCGSSGSSAAASMVGGRGLGVHPIYSTSAPSLPLLRPSARNLELQGLHCFSTGGMERADQKKLLVLKHKAENVLQLWWQRSSDHVKNYRSPISDDPYVKHYRSIRVFGTITFLAYLSYLVMVFRAVHLNDVGSGTSNTGKQNPTRCPYPKILLLCYPYVHLSAYCDFCDEK